MIDAQSVSGSPNDYRSYVEGSRGEFSVAKNTYVATHCGWFSCRTACYLASGRPALVQDTGWTAHLHVMAMDGGTWTSWGSATGIVRSA